MSDALERLRSAPAKVVGLKQTLKAVRRGEVELVFMAEDAEPHVLRELQQLCQEQAIPIEWVASMRELGKAAGIQVNSATVALLRV
ncbi:MAG: 50S ribosomal protein L7Ae-like protein [Firmicutes bacterium]|jgi:large subunit ribosomal protein L7A|nr:50S ribosomal protein L7Ae-like protein [Bacillota bacterium]